MIHLCIKDEPRSNISMVGCGAEGKLVFLELYSFVSSFLIFFSKAFMLYGIKFPFDFFQFKYLTPFTFSLLVLKLQFELNSFVFNVESLNMQPEHGMISNFSSCNSLLI